MMVIGHLFHRMEIPGCNPWILLIAMLIEHEYEFKSKLYYAVEKERKFSGICLVFFF